MSDATRKPTVFEVVTKLIFPVLSLVALILGQINDRLARFQWALLSLTVLFAVIAFYPFVGSKLAIWKRFAEGRWAVRNALPRLKALVRSFGEFVDARRADTFHYIVHSRLFGGNASTASRLPMPDIDLWGGLCEFYRMTIDGHSPNTEEFLNLVMEFHFLVTKYNNCCLAPVFVRLPPDLRERLTPEVKSDLNAFQQRFMLFLRDYETFSQDLADSHPMFASVPRSFVLPPPL